ncbi:MAG: hypothetical protein WC791_04420 [Candidatus Paceibacterota bacterium]|jgi:hypothetical protein
MMIIITNNQSKKPSARKGWETKFALLPTCVEESSEGKKYVLFGWYETRAYPKPGDIHCRETRIPGSRSSYKIHLFRDDMAICE